ncbi:hypothetical protein [Dolichospermum sp. UHCC 0259]|uniref:hypothetical protein n=1 Tax=Dolichospermum sp. UHCC 0259 TaxID=2590010 RepID=UPI0014487D6A|nr:hypothetical protein [Dolichospermum sp. UHCC 0259]MTJ49845.1 hypothetical protein [Dolichospermum sp. UHCC 0259]
MKLTSPLKITKGAIIRLNCLFLAMLVFSIWLKQSGGMENSQLLETLYRQGNYIESGLWGLFAIGFLVYSYKSHTLVAKRKNQIVAFIFLVFGISDIIEVQTGAWWKPWWLFLWKASCVIGFMICFWDFWQNNIQQNQEENE